MRLARTIFLEGAEMRYRPIALVNLKAVRRMPLRKSCHEPVAGDLGDNRRRSDRREVFVSFYDGFGIYLTHRYRFLLISLATQKEAAVQVDGRCAEQFMNF